MADRFVGVVGGAGTIGQAIVRRYAALPNTNVLVIDRHNFPAAKNYHNVEHCKVDVTQARTIADLAERLKKRGIAIAHLISLAGGSLADEWGDLATVPDQTLQDSITLNLTSHVWLTKHLMKGDLPGDRSIIFISSINARSSYGLTAYSAAKAGLLGLTRELAGSLAPKIRVNAITPGTIVTERTSRQPKKFAELKRKTLLRRFAEPRDIAAAAYFLTDLTTNITGAEIVVDAGQSLSTK
ncbi:MAG TPA: SDR family oxidoreductase [Candidatus Saccharimonadales bacterium]|nr:SDR family oxidoreductase [Candidatus Saccharimonadales bacterium]